MVDILGYEGLYAITENGEVWSYISQKFLKPIKEHNGYLRVFLYRNGKRRKYPIHRLVLETFNPIDNMDKLTVNHKDENKENNVLNNLEWMTLKDNNNYGTRNERAGKANSVVNLNNEKRSKKIMCVETEVIYPSTHEAERRTGINQSCICKAAKNIERKTAGGYHWKYI